METRAEKMDWCKTRALENLEYGHSIEICFQGFLSDLIKMELDDPMVTIVCQCHFERFLTGSMDGEEFKYFIEGFN